MFTISGTVEEVGEVKTFSSGFQKREIVVNTAAPESKYTNPVKFSFKKENCAKLDGVRVGAKVTVSFVVDGRRWDGGKGTQYFVDLTGIKIAAEGGAAAPGVAKCLAPDAGDDAMPF